MIGSIGRVVGACGAPVIAHDSGFLGLYGVDANYQSKGIGSKLFKRCMDHIGHRNCGLHAVPDKLSIYRDRAGFEVVEGVQMVDCGGLPLNWNSLMTATDDRMAIQELDRQDARLIAKVIDFDSKVHKQSREQLMRSTLAKPDYKTFAAIDIPSDRLVGFGCIRPDNSGQAMIGPVYADDDFVAEALVHKLIASSMVAQTQGLLFMTVSTSLGGLRIADKLQLKEKSRCERLFTKRVIPVDYRYIYCLQSPNFSL